ncbi:hypothetical protein [Streptomyces sp. NPDC056844]|uniref:hypothetical protein n=1 Tax=unclassified Streptomyces TaxID=2593676 RepID=UPI003678796A
MSSSSAAPLPVNAVLGRVLAVLLAVAVAVTVALGRVARRRITAPCRDTAPPRPGGPQQVQVRRAVHSGSPRQGAGP